MIPATKEAEIRRITVLGQPGQRLESIQKRTKAEKGRVGG
jgi:hypothetical protein